MSARGVSAVEVLLATAVVAVALVAVMTLSQSQQRNAFFAEYHVQAEWRAAALLSALAVRDPADLERDVAPQGLDASGAETAVPARLLPAPGRVVIEWISAARAAPGKALEVLDASAASRTPFFRDEAFLAREVAGPAGSLLWRLHARVSWQFPGDQRPHAYDATQLVSRPGLSHQLLPALPATGGAP